MSTTSSTLTSVLSALGGSTGIDVTDAVNAILYADRAPERGWQTQQTTLNTQAAAIEQIQSEASSLTDALSNLQTSGGVLSSTSAASSNTNVLTATAADSTLAGSHLIVVKSLATTGSWYSAAEASSSTALSAGSFNITANGKTTGITINSGDTLTSLAASINSQSLGVTASVVTDSTGARLTLVSQTSGSAADVSVSGATGLSFTRANTGADASLTVDGVPISSASNTVTGAISGVTLNLLSSSAGDEISLNLAPDSSSISTAVNSFVTAYNTLITDVNSQFIFDKATNTAGTLSGDSTIFGLQSALLGLTNFTGASGSITSLAQLGISTNQDGTLSLDTDTLNSAVTSNSSAVATFFQGASSNGFAASVTNTLDTYTDSTQGAFTIDLKSISSEYTDLGNQIDTLELYLTSQQTILTAKYNAADIAIQELPQQIKQIQALLNPNSNSSSS